MLQSIRLIPGVFADLLELPDPAAQMLLTFAEGAIVDVLDPQPPIPAGSTATADKWAFVKFDDGGGTVLSGWVERKFLDKAEEPKVPLDEMDFVRRCVLVETRYNAGGEGEQFPVDADYLLAWSLIASGMTNPPPDPANEGASGPFALTDTEWKEYIADLAPGVDPPTRNDPLAQAFAAGFLSRKRMQALSEKLTDPALPDGPYIPTYLNVFHAQLLGVDAAVEVQKLLAAREGATTIDTVLVKTVPDQAARDALTKRHEKFLKDGANPQMVESFRAKTSRLLNDRFTRAFKLIKQHMPESIPPKAEIGATGSWFAIAEKEMKDWQDAGLTEKSGEGKKRVLEYFKATDLETDKVLAWCGAFVSHCLKTAGDPGASSVIKESSWAANWKKWGDTKLLLRSEDTEAGGIPKGAVVLFEPLAAGASGHVGFFHSLKDGNKIVIIGGNQTGGVSLKAINRGKLVAIRWLAAVPTGGPPPDDTPVTGGAPVADGTPVAGATNDDVLTLARTLYGEARGEFDKEGKGDMPVEAVANVIVNRAARKFGGRSTVRGVCLHPSQFSCWNGNDTNRAKIKNLVKGADREFDRCLAVAARAIKGEIPDHTRGALHYHATSIAKPKWVRNSPNAKVTLKVGAHIFYTGIK